MLTPLPLHFKRAAQLRRESSSDTRWRPRSFRGFTAVFAQGVLYSTRKYCIGDARRWGRGGDCESWGLSRVRLEFMYTECSANKKCEFTWFQYPT